MMMTQPGMAKRKAGKGPKGRSQVRRARARLEQSQRDAAQAARLARRPAR